MSLFRIYSDGSRNEQGFSKCGIAVFDPEDRLFCQKTIPIGHYSNESAEVSALRMASELALELKLKNVVFFFDYKNAWNYIFGQYPYENVGGRLENKLRFQNELNKFKNNLALFERAYCVLIPGKYNKAHKPSRGEKFLEPKIPVKPKYDKFERSSYSPSLFILGDANSKPRLY
jgi:ribonuclease HI